MKDDTKQRNAIGAMAEVAAMMMRGASMIPIGAMKTACDLQERAIDLMESFVPGVAPETGQSSGGVGQPLPAAASVSPSPASGTAGATTGWGPVTAQAQVTGWGPMPRPQAGGATTVNAGAAPPNRSGMQVLVVFEVFHTIIDPQRLQQAVTQTHTQLNRIFASGAAVASGAFTGRRGGFVLLNVTSGEELLQLMAPGLSDNCTIEMWPVLPFDQQATVLQQTGLMHR